MIFDLFFITFIVLYFIILGITILIRKIRNKKKNIKYRIWIVALLEGYILFLFKMVILPICIYSKEYLKAFHRECNIPYTQLIPFNTIIPIIKSGMNILVQIGGNIVLFIPIPIFIGLMCKRNFFNEYKSIICGLFISLGIEIIQLLIDIIFNYPAKVFDVDDIILNTLGYAIGFVMYLGLKKCSKIHNFVLSELVYI